MSIEQPSHSVLMIGLTDTGKTNYLSRLWLALDRGGGLLEKAGLPNELNYLKDCADHLLMGEFAPHTPQGVHDTTVIPVKAAAGGTAFSGALIVPDLPGEQVMKAYRARQWSDEWEDRIVDGTGCLIFVRVDSSSLVPALDWVSCSKLFGTTIGDALIKRDDQGAALPPTQVILVDWLQFLRQAFTHRVAGHYRPRIGIVVAAWDLVPREQRGKGPELWVRENLPMLWQFVNSNDDDFYFSYFGVSVTSGDLSRDEEFKKAYLDGDPTKAGEVVHQLSGNLEVASDITLPVAWAMGLAESANGTRN